MTLQDLIYQLMVQYLEVNGTGKESAADLMPMAVKAREEASRVRANTP